MSWLSTIRLPRPHDTERKDVAWTRWSEKAARPDDPAQVALLDALSFKARCYSAMAQMLGTRSATERLERLLVFLATVYGLKERDGIVIAASFTHADLAHMTGVTRQSVTISLKKFTELGILAAHGSNLVIKNADMLSEIRDGKLAKVAASDDV